MATFRKRGSAWRVEVCVQGTRRSATFDTKSEGRAWADRVEDELRRGEDAAGGRRTLGDAMLRFAAEVAPGRSGGRWEQIRLAKLSRDPVADVRLDRLRPQDLADWRDRRLTEVQGSSVRREMGLLRTVLELCRTEWRWISSNPIDDVRKPPNPKHRDQRISDEDAARITSALGYDDGVAVDSKSQRIAVAFLIAIETGMRAGELFSLTWDQVFLEDRFVHLVKTKNGDSRDVPLSTRAVGLFRRLPISADDRRCFQSTVVQMDPLFRKARDRADLRNITFHDSRHEATTRLSRKLDVLELARVIGHRDPKSLMVYYNATAQEIAAKLD